MKARVFGVILTEEISGFDGKRQAISFQLVVLFLCDEINATGTDQRQQRKHQEGNDQDGRMGPQRRQMVRRVVQPFLHL